MEITSKKLKEIGISRYKIYIDVVMGNHGTEKLKHFSYRKKEIGLIIDCSNENNLELIRCYDGINIDFSNNILNKPKNSVLHFGTILNGIFTNILKTLKKDNIEEYNELYNEVSDKLFQQLIENEKIIANPNTIEDKDFFRKKLVLGEYDEYLKDVFKELQITDINEQQKYFKYVFYIKILELIQLSENLLINIFEEEKPILDTSYGQLRLLLNNFFTELEENKLVSNKDTRNSIRRAIDSDKDTMNLVNTIKKVIFNFLVNEDLSNYIKYFIEDIIFEEKNAELIKDCIKNDKLRLAAQKHIIKHFQEKLDVFNELGYNEFNLTRTFDSLFEIISNKNLSTDIINDPNISFVDIIKQYLTKDELLYCIEIFVIDNFNVLKLKCKKIIENGQITQETKERYTEFLKTKLEGVNAYSKTKCSLKEFFTQLGMYDLSANLDSKTLGVLFDAVKILVKENDLKDYIEYYVENSFNKVKLELANNIQYEIIIKKEINEMKWNTENVNTLLEIIDTIEIKEEEKEKIRNSSIFKFHSITSKKGFKPETFKEIVISDNKLFSQVFVSIMCNFISYGMRVNEYQNSIYDSLKQAFSAFDSVEQGIGK